MIVRSTHAHARIRSIDIAAAPRRPGVVAVFTGADLARDGLGTMQMTLKRKRPDGSPMFAPPHRGLDRRPRALRRRSRGHGDRRDAGPGRGRRRAGPDRLRAAALGDLHRGGRRARRARGLGRVPRQHLQPLRGRRQGGHRRGVRDGAPRRHAAATSSPACTPSTWSRAARWASTIRARSATRSTPTCSIPHRVRNMLASNIFKVPEQQDPRDRGRRRRRLRHQGLAVSRASPGPVGGAQAAAGRSSGRASAARPMLADEHAPRQRQRGRAGARRGRHASSRCASQHARQRRRLRRRRTATCSRTFGNVVTLRRRLRDSRPPTSTCWAC